MLRLNLGFGQEEFIGLRKWFSISQLHLLFFELDGLRNFYACAQNNSALVYLEKHWTNIMFI